MVNTNGATISLKTIMFDNANGHYAIYRTNGSSFISMLTSGTSASAINVVAGNHAMHADVTMGSSLNVDIGAASSLTFHAALSGGSSLSLTKTGAGTLFFESNSNYAGNTEIRSGLVSLLAGSTPPGSGTVSVLSGGQATVSGTAGGVFSVSGSASFGSLVTGHIDVNNGGSVAFNGSNVAGSPFNVAPGGVASVGSTAMIGTGGLNLGTACSPGVFDLLGLTADSYSLPSTASLAGVRRWRKRRAAKAVTTPASGSPIA